MFGKRKINEFIYLVLQVVNGEVLFILWRNRQLFMVWGWFV